MRTPKLHAHHDKNPEKNRSPASQTTKPSWMHSPTKQGLMVMRREGEVVEKDSVLLCKQSHITWL